MRGLRSLIPPRGGLPDCRLTRGQCFLITGYRYLVSLRMPRAQCPFEPFWYGRYLTPSTLQKKRGLKLLCTGYREQKPFIHPPSLRVQSGGFPFY